ncbi:MAG: histidine phosphatase family protein [Bernardetiaceae bacterium]|nr:histidine phosphatase family protein [Bernardetiaceae bacterium]
MKLYLVRHGQPEISEYSGCPGPQLGQKGIQQAHRIAEILTKKNITQILGSDYTRVIETAQPFLAKNKQLKYLQFTELRERENEFETHESLVHRVQNWFRSYSMNFESKSIVIFGHCGSLNMILQYLDPELQKMAYPYKDQYQCLTPIGGVWQLEFEGKKFIKGSLIYDGEV